MFRIVDGLLQRDGKPIFTIGQSYYPSYHAKKVPVPPEGDREGEAKYDLAAMKDAGFNLVRFAALGEEKRNAAGQVEGNWPFIDFLLDETARNGLAAMVRLNGYSVNFSNLPDAGMLDADGGEMPFYWWAFVRNCINHPEILRDNHDATSCAAEHFAKFPAVAGYQIYNEPAYPRIGLYDYNPHSIAAWRNFLVERKICTAAETANLDAPRHRPAAGEDAKLWQSWMQFRLERLNDFLNGLSDAAHAAAPEIATCTCDMPCPISFGAAIRGEDYYRIAEKMDFVGITHYVPAKGPGHYRAGAIIDLAESAAAVYGKRAWIIEYNCRTELEAAEYERETYSAIGSGVKGILYYQWRADYPAPDAPEPEGFGMIRSDRSKTPKFDRAVAMNKLVSRLSDTLVAADKLRSGVALLFSEHANIWSDANAPDFEPSVIGLVGGAAALRRAGIAVDFVRSADLKANVLGEKLVVVPCRQGLSENELAELEFFRQNGGTVVNYNPLDGGFDHLSAAELLKKYNIEPQFETATPTLDAKLLLTPDGGTLVAALINIGSFDAPIPDGTRLKLTVPEPEKFKSAKWYTPNREMELAFVVENGRLTINLPEVDTGAFIVCDANP